MNARKRYSIGEMSCICSISKKTLRYYDEIGLITSQRQDYNNYRYYTHDSLLLIPVLKYYKQMGFKLDEMRAFLEGSSPNVYRTLRHSFMAKISELEKDQEELRRQYASVKDWLDLIVEAEMVIDHNISEVSIKFVESANLLYQQQVYENDTKSSIINIDFTNFVEEMNNKITGPVMLNFSSMANRLENKRQDIRILQRVLMPCPEEALYRFGGCFMATCYHIGSHDSISDSYRKICTWAKQHNYLLGKESFERYVTDYWTTSNSAQFVTEIMVRASRAGAEPSAEQDGN